MTALRKIGHMAGRLTDALGSPDRTLNRTGQVRAGLSTFALLFILLPWLPVGADGSLTGSQLIGHTLLSQAIPSWFEANPLGTVLFVAMPTLVVLLCFGAAWKELRGRPALVARLIIIAAPLLTLALASYPMMDHRPDRWLGVAVPQIGLLHIIAIHTALAAHTATLKTIKWVKAKQDRVP